VSDELDLLLDCVPEYERFLPVRGITILGVGAQAWQVNEDQDEQSTAWSEVDLIHECLLLGKRSYQRISGTKIIKDLTIPVKWGLKNSGLG
jgi:hypothetical protein